MAQPRRKGGFIVAIAVASICICLLQQDLRVHQYCPNETWRGGQASLSTLSHLLPVLYADGLRHDSDQQHTLAASLSEVDAAARAAPTSLFDESDCTYPSDDVHFEKVITKTTLRELLERSPQVMYRGNNTPSEAAAAMHKHISCAIQTHASFRKFCNTDEKGTKGENAFVNLSECMAFLAHAAVRTHFWTKYSDTTLGRECSPSEKHPCGPPAASYHARGPFMLHGNEAYGAFGEAVVNDAEKLLNNPELIDSEGIGGWATALWLWMSDRPYGLNCPETVARSGKTSCHAAMLHQDSPPEAIPNALRDNDEAALKDAIAGFGLTVHINGGSGMECCPVALEAFQRDRSLQLQGATASAGAAAAFSLPGATPPQADAGTAPRSQTNPKGESLSWQEQLFRIMMSGGDGSQLPVPTPGGGVAKSGSSDAQQSESTMLPGALPLTVASPFLSGQMSSSPTAAASVTAAPFQAAVAGMAPPPAPLPAPPPFTSALLVSTFLSFLAVELPKAPATDDKEIDEERLPFITAHVPWKVPLPGAADGLCWTQGVLALQAAAAKADDREQGKAAVLESRFCLSLVRGCPSLFPRQAAEVSKKSIDEDAVKAVEEAVAKHTDNARLVFKCFDTTPSGFAAAAAEASSGTSAELRFDDEEKLKDKLNEAAKEKRRDPFSYIAEQGVTCAFFTTKTLGL